MPKIKPIPKTEHIEFKPKFVERYSKLTDWKEFRKYSLSFLPRSIRVNTLKKSVAEIKKRLGKNWVLTPIPWCKEGFWVEHKKGRLDIGHAVEHALGYFFVQESASMIPPIVLNPKPGEKVLDLCAAPGAKASQIAQYMDNKGVLVANDLPGIRQDALRINLQRMGVLNCVITKKKGEHFKNELFDKVLLDAPCSGTGAIRKSIKTIEMWNPKTIKSMAGVQKVLIQNAFNLLRKNGVLVYSTCSLEPEENEGVVDWLLGKNKDAVVEKIDLKNIKKSECITKFEKHSYSKEVKKCLRIWPQDNNSEGFFVAKILKK